MTGVGAHSEPAATAPTGSVWRSPSGSRKTTETASSDAGSPLLRANRRTVGCSTPKHIGAVVAEDPAGSASDRSPARNGSLPSATAAPPVKAHASPPPSTSPPGAGTYQAGSNHGWNVWVTGCEGQPAARACAGTARTRAASARAPAGPMRRKRETIAHLIPTSVLFVRRTYVQRASPSILPDMSGPPEMRDPGVVRRLSGRERRVETAVAALFAVTAAAMLAASSGWDEPLSAVLLTATYALVDRVSFQLGPGFVSPTQLVFVPMLFLLPPEAVPALVAAGSVLSVLPDIVLRRAHAERAIVAIADSWYAGGPAAVFALLDPGPPGWSDVGVYALALVAQFGVSAAVSAAREWFGAGIAPRELAPVLGVICLVDLLLSPIGYMAVLASEDHAYAYLLAVPPGGLLALIARERRRRTEQELALGQAYQRSAEQLSAQAEELRRARLRVGEAIASTLDRDGLERLLLATAVEAVEGDCGRLGAHAIGDVGRFAEALGEAEVAAAGAPAPQERTAGGATALAIPLVSSDRSRELLVVARAGTRFSPAES